MPEVRFLGHACVTISEGKHKLIVDPFINDNPKSPVKAKDVEADYILLSHGHGDHVGDAIAIAKQNDATIIANFELSNLCASLGAKTHSMHIGGSHAFEFGRIKLTIAHHGGGYGPDASRYTGPPVGFLITIGKKVIYHSGDTGLFYDMKLIGDMNAIDLAFLPIGDNYTMGVEDAAKAVEFLNPKRVIPIHFNTWDIINADPKQFSAKVKNSEVIILQPGESYRF